MIVLFFLLLLMCPPLSLIYAIVGFLWDARKWRRYLFFLVYFFFMFITALTLVENSNYDLVRYYQYMDQAAGLSFLEALNFRNDNLFTMNVLYWLFGRMGYHQLLPAFSVSIIVFSLGYITCDLAESQKAWHLVKYVLLYQFMVMPLMYNMEVVRSGLAFCLITLMAYLDIVKKKRKLWIYLVYIACVFIHNAALLFIVFRLVCLLPKSVRKIALLFPLVVGTLITFAFNHLELFSGYKLLYTIIRKANVYFYKDIGYALNTMNNLYFKRLKFVMVAEAVLMVVIAAYFMFVISKRRSQIIELSKPEQDFLMFFTSINIAALSIITAPSPMYWRVTTAAYCCCAIYMLPTIRNYRVLPALVRVSYWGLWLLAIPALYLNLRRILSYPDNFITWLEDSLLTNIFTVFFRVAKAL